MKRVTLLFPNGKDEVTVSEDQVKAMEAKGYRRKDKAVKEPVRTAAADKAKDKTA